MKVWKGYTIQVPLLLLERLWPPSSLKNTFLQEKLCPDVVHDFKRFTAEPTEEITHTQKKLWLWQNSGRERFQDMDPGEMSEPRAITPGS